MKQLFTTLLLLLFCFTAKAQSSYDQLQPFGFATMSSRTDNTSTFNLTGGGAYTYPATGQYVLQASGATDDTDYNAIRNAISSHDIVILDGSNGDFTITKTMDINNLSGKTIIGINNARLCTKWYVTSVIKGLLDAADVGSKSTSSGTGGTLDNGQQVDEAREYWTRKVMLEYTQDNDESYRKSGVFKFSGCSNIILRNIKFVGPGPIDCGGQDLVWFNGTTHAWVDHCEFSDGLDGNFDITNASDFVTVSWCKFYYTERAYDHMNTNLVGGSDSRPADEGLLNVTFAYNHWGTLCRQRMPMARYGKIHMLNNYYTCTGNTGPCINPRTNAEFLIEGNYFDSSITNVFSQTNATSWVWSNSYANAIESGAYVYSSGSCSVPYTYSTSLTASNVPTEVGNNVGNVLYDYSASNITACTVAGSSATIDGTTITAEVPYTYSTTVPVTITLSDGATADNGTSFNMTLAAAGEATANKTIIVTAGNNVNNKTYTLTITRAEAPASTWGLTQSDLTTSTGITTTTTYTGESISSFVASNASMGGSSKERSLTNGTTSISSVVSSACQRNNLCPGASDFVDDSYYAFTINVASGYKLDISGFYGDLYYETGRSGKYKFAVYSGSTKVWEAGSSDYVTTGGSNNSQKTLDVSSVEALQGLTGAVQIRMVWYQNGSSSYVALKDFNITARVKEDARTLYDLTTTASPAEGGTIELNPAGGSYEENTEVTMTATANDGYYFVNWTNASSAVVTTTNAYSYTMGTEATSFTANFGKYPVITFSKGESGAEGTVPTAKYTSTGEFTIPTNNSLYVEGKTLTAWNDGNANYAIGETISGITADITLTPVFTDNAFTLNSIPKTIVDIPFTQNAGAPVMRAEGTNYPTTMRVVQVPYGNQFIDLLLSVNGENGKFNNNQGNPDACQINATTTLTVPAVNGMTITLNKEFSTSFIGTSTTGTASDGSTTWTYEGTDATVTLTINESNTYPTLMTLEYPNGSHTLTLGQNGYSTFAGEHNFTVSGAGTAYVADYDAINSKVVLTAIHPDAVIEQGAGIVLRGAQAGDEVTITFTDEVADIDNTGLEGVISSTTSIADNPYVIASNGTQTAFVKAGAYGTVAALMHKAYLNGTTNGLQVIPLTFDEATDIDGIKENVHREGRGMSFTLDGRRLNGVPNRHGAYISDGKVIIK